MFDGLPAFILGNGPTLPVDDLGCLDGCFTVGVNRIVRVYEPTVLLWVDGSVYTDDSEDARLIDEAESLKVCDQSVWQRQGWIGLKTWTGDNAVRHETTPTELCCNGNTGCTAARWAIALGCNPVYLVGMCAKYQGTGEDLRTDFYGVNDRHHVAPLDDDVPTSITLHHMTTELTRLTRDFPDVKHIPFGDLLRDVAADCGGIDQDETRAKLRSLLGEV